VGLGAGANALAALRELRRLRDTGELASPVEIVSFERDMDAFRLALSRPAEFPHLVGEEAPARLLQDGVWEEPQLRWRLVEGDFTATYAVEAARRIPRLVYYDMFSSKTQPELWDGSLFARMVASFGDAEVELFTYTASGVNRAALLQAGFWVARGVATPPKKETTIALSRSAASRATHRRLLGDEWITRLRRAEKKLSAEEFSVRYAPVLAHPQFAR
jgi:queuine tRNA-ribosyltransferase